MAPRVRRMVGMPNAPTLAAQLRAMKILYDRAKGARKDMSMAQYASARGRSINRSMSVDQNRGKTPIGLKLPYNSNYRWKKRVQRTRGFSGKFKKLKRFKLKGRKKRIAQAIEFKYEDGGISQDTQCVYLGLGSCPMIYLRRVLCACIVKELSRQAQLSFNDWKESPFVDLPTGSIMSIRIDYYATVTSNALLDVTTTSVSEAAGDTWENLATNLNTTLITIIGNPHLVVDHITLRYADGGANTKIRGKIECADMYITASFFGNMNLQNATLAADGIGGETVDIANNPLYGKMYHTNKGNGFLPISRQDFVSNVSLTCDPVTGLIDATGSQLSNNFKKPVAPQLIRKVSSHSNINLNPGEMKKFYVKYNKTHSFTNWITLIGEDYLNLENYLREGTATMVALEKKLNNRTESNAIVINYEVNYSFGGSYRYSQKPITMPIVQII